MRNFIRGLTASLVLAALPWAANAGVFVSVTIAPPVLPVYVPPPMPAAGYIWTPGYWAWADDGYYWVPGTWVLAPAPGLLWTPGYWAWGGGVYLWHAGYWGPHVGFYGGVNYGFGYSGVGFHGGYWSGGTYIVNRVAIGEAPVNRVCFNGGAGGIAAHASGEELRFAHERHLQMSEAQHHNQLMASRDNTMRANWNHGRPPVAATAKPGVFYGHGVVASRAGPEHSAGFERVGAEHGMEATHAAGAPHPMTASARGEPYRAGQGEPYRAPPSANHGAYPAAAPHPMTASAHGEPYRAGQGESYRAPPSANHGAYPAAARANSPSTAHAYPGAPHGAPQAAGPQHGGERAPHAEGARVAPANAHPANHGAERVQRAEHPEGHGRPG